MIEHTESAFYYGNSDKTKFYEHREFTKLYHKWIIGTRQEEGNSQEETETFFNKQTSKNNFYYREMVRTRSSRPYFFSKCHLHHRGEELFAIFFLFNKYYLTFIEHLHKRTGA